MTREVNIEYCRFLVMDRPCCVWKADLSRTNQQFLAHLDPSYFLYQVAVHRAALAEVDSDPTKPQAVHATLALRTSYGQALEAFFALVGATLQAPDCVFGWLGSYKTEELKRLVRSISKAEPVPALAPFDKSNWKDIAATLFEPVRDIDVAAFDTASENFASVWSRLAADFLDEHSTFEYNCLKHGFRTEPIPAKLSLKGPNGLLIESSPKFGHSFPHLERMAKPQGPIHHQVSRTILALDPDRLASSLEVLSVSMRNFLSYLRGRAGLEASEGIVPTEKSFYELVRSDAVPITRFTLNEKVTPVSGTEYFTADEIRAIYERASG